MKREFLKELGVEDETVEQIIAEYGKDVQGFQTQVETLTAERDGLKEQLTAANEQIEAFKELDVDGIKAAADDWKQKYEQSEKDRETQTAELKFSHALESQLAGAKAKDVGILMGLIDRESLKLTDDGKILGLEDQLSKIKEEKGFLFETDETVPTLVAGGTGGSAKGSADAALKNALGLKTGKGE